MTCPPWPGWQTWPIWSCTLSCTDRPTMMAFDLDPGPPADIVLCCKIALHLKEIFDQLGLQSFAKTSGSKGLQVYVPLNTPTSYEKTKTFSRTLAERFEA